MSLRVISRVVFDTNTVVSALLFGNGRLAWSRLHWREGCIPLISQATAAELIRVLGYPKFRLSREDQLELMGDYLPYCETIVVLDQCSILCRDRADQMFLDLAQSGRADLLVTGDTDLLALDGQVTFHIENSEAYQHRVLAK